jgi:CRP/FNR family transcriptional regulator, cyclic AMP receptor protein
MKLPNIFEKDVVPLFYTAGSTIFEVGQPRDLMFIVQEGEVEIRIGNKVVETVSVDGFFGEMALIDGGTRSATAVAKTDCKLIPINEKQFLFMVQETPFFSLRVMRTLTARLRQVDRRLLQSEVESSNS